jgi:hypothetical protein
MRKFVALLVLILAGAPAGWGQVGSSGKDLFGKTPGPDDPLLPPSPYAGKPLPELKGVVSWRTLAQVEAVQVKDRVVPQFSKNVTALDRKEVKLQGFMMPLEMGEKQKRFLLVSMPPSCAFCLPGGPDSVVEVVAKAPVKYGFDPIVLSGRFVVLKDDPLGLYYRLTDAVSVTR